MKNVSKDATVGTSADRCWSRGILSSVQRWVPNKNAHTGHWSAVPLLSSVALAFLLSGCGGGGGDTTAAASVPAPALPATSSISGVARAPGGLLTIGVLGSSLAAQDPLAVDRQPSVMAAASQQASMLAGVDLLPSILRSPPYIPFVPVRQKPVILRVLRSFGPTYGPPIAQATTDGNGGYVIDIPAGTSEAAVLVVTVGAANEVPMSAIVTGHTVDVDPVTQAAFQVIASYARRNNLSSISLDLAAELVTKIDDIAAAMPAAADSGGAADSYAQAAAGSASVNSSLAGQLPPGVGIPLGGAGISQGPPDTPPPPNPGSTGTWYAHYTLNVCSGGVCFPQAYTAPGNNAYNAQSTCLEEGRRVAAELARNPVPGLTYSYTCNQTP